MNELKLIKGSPIEIANGLFVYPLRMDEIAEIGESLYNSYLSIITSSKKILYSLEESIISKQELTMLSKESDLFTILYISEKDQNTFAIFINALKTFLKSELDFDGQNLILKNDSGLFTFDDELFKKFKEVIMKQNFLKDDSVSTYKPANSKAKALLEKLKKAKEKIQEQNSDDGLRLKDIISIVATYSNDINLLSVWDLTIYQLYEAYLRLIVWDKYHTNFLLLPHVSDSGSLDLQHWATDINKIK
ncbi:hypothetical protein [Heyndrickxia camelliae]|uniref:Uncharacterized protein n=1 Tax=Heyndrickxia camelliae TaxID=1707093 RepID=A0A2N3LE33_9BACI|nr:hypothetical protein [Heyndrickxia camelliae]PKR82849.1 hypothetical protein CWO92_21910 [Heyndrickxia camelliae]